MKRSTQSAHCLPHRLLRVLIVNAEVLFVRKRNRVVEAETGCNLVKASSPDGLGEPFCFTFQPPIPFGRALSLLDATRSKTFRIGPNASSYPER